MGTTDTLLEKAKIFLKKKVLPNNLYSAAHPFYYLASWTAKSLGHHKLNCLRSQKKISKALVSRYIREFLNLGYYDAFDLHLSKTYVPSQNMMISWCNKESFLDDVSFQCRYFNKNSQEAQGINWVLISTDGFIPSYYHHNISIFYNCTAKKRSLCSLIKNIFYCIRNRIPCLPESLFAKKFSDSILLQFDVLDTKRVILAYEGQPWQHTLCLTLKKRNPAIEVIGDLHSCLPPFPTDFIKRHGAPDKIIVHGQGQKDILVNKLEWSNKDIDVQLSQRLDGSNYQDLSGKIFLSYTIPDKELVINSLSKFFDNYAKSYGRFDLKNHPAQLRSDEHCLLIEEIVSLQSKALGSQQKKAVGISIVIGASSVIMECLTYGIKVFHIVDDLVFQSYDSSIWSEITSTQLNRNLLCYEANKKLTYFDIRKTFTND